MIKVDRLLDIGASAKKYNANEIIFEEGTECYFYYQLVSGTVRWLQVREDGKEFVQDLIEPGECFGEFPLFDGRPYAASALASNECEVVRLPKNIFKQLLKDDPDLHFAFSKLLVERLRFRVRFS